MTTEWWIIHLISLLMMVSVEYLIGKCGYLRHEIVSLPWKLLFAILHLQLNRLKVYTDILELATLLSVVYLLSKVSDTVKTKFRFECIHKHIWMVVRTLRSFRSELLSSCKGWVARHTNSWSGENAWSRALSFSASRKFSEVGINTKVLQNYTFYYWILIIWIHLSSSSNTETVCLGRGVMESRRFSTFEELWSSSVLLLLL